MEKIIREKFLSWDENIEDPKLSELKNKILIQRFESLLKCSENAKVIENYNNYTKDKNIVYGLNILSFGLEKKLEIFLLNESEILSKVYFDHINGGRVGLVHGGCLFFVLLLNVNIFIKEILKLSTQEYQLLKIKTQYKKKVPVNNYILIRVYISNSFEISAEMLDSENQICTKIICNYEILFKKAKF